MIQAGRVQPHCKTALGMPGQQQSQSTRAMSSWLEGKLQDSGVSWGHWPFTTLFPAQFSESLLNVIFLPPYWSTLLGFEKPQETCQQMSPLQWDEPPGLPGLPYAWYVPERTSVLPVLGKRFWIPSQAPSRCCCQHAVSAYCLIGSDSSDCLRVSQTTWWQW